MLHKATFSPFGTLIQKRLYQLEKTSRWLAGEVNVTPAHISNLIHSKRIPRYKTVERIATALHLNVDEVVNTLEKKMIKHSDNQEWINQKLSDIFQHKTILRALSELDSPSEELASMLIQVQKAVSFELSYATCTQLLRDAKKSLAKVESSSDTSTKKSELTISVKPGIDKKLFTIMLSKLGFIVTDWQTDDIGYDACCVKVSYGSVYTYRKELEAIPEVHYVRIDFESDRQAGT